MCDAIAALRMSIRNNGPGFMRGKKQWREVPVDKRFGTSKDELKTPVATSKRVLDWYEEEMPGSQVSICSDVLNINYNIYCDVNRPPVAGENSLGVNVELEWTNTPVVAKLFTDQLTSVTFEASVTKAISSNAKDLSGMAKSCGLRSHDIKDLAVGDIDKFLCTLSSANMGQSKITRLVKGFLIYRDLLHCEHKRASFDFHPNSVAYDVKTLVKMSGSSDNAYVWCDAPSSVSYAAALYMMCEEYPNANVPTRCDVSIPADGKKIYLVSMGSSSTSKKVTLTSDVMWASLLKYCDVMSLGNCLEEVSIIACSLAENRYHTTVALPRVVSSVDLVYPATVARGAIGSTQKPYMDLDTMRCIGRTHQLLSFVVLKDIIVSALNTSLNGVDPYLIMKTYLKAQSFNFSKYTNVSSILNLLHVTKRMDFLSHLSSDDVAAIYGTSIFEGLWLVDRMNDAMAKGVIDNMKRGKKDRMRGYSDVYTHQDYVSGLEHELRLAMLDPTDYDLSEGDWVIDVCYLNSDVVLRPKKRFRTVKVNYTKVIMRDEAPAPVVRKAYASRNAKTAAAMSRQYPFVAPKKTRKYETEELNVLRESYSSTKSTLEDRVEEEDEIENRVEEVIGERVSEMVVKEITEVRKDTLPFRPILRTRSVDSMAEAMSVASVDEVPPVSQLPRRTVTFGRPKFTSSVDKKKEVYSGPEIAVNMADLEYLPSELGANESADFFRKYFNVSGMATVCDQLRSRSAVERIRVDAAWFWVRVVDEDPTLMKIVAAARLATVAAKVDVGTVNLRACEALVIKPSAYQGPFDSSILGHYHRLTYNEELTGELGLKVDLDGNLDWRTMPILFYLDAGGKIPDAIKLVKVLGSNPVSDDFRNLSLMPLVGKETAFVKYHSHKKGKIEFLPTSSMTKRYNYIKKDCIVGTIAAFTKQLCVPKKVMQKFLKVFDMGEDLNMLRGLNEPLADMD